jgi:hypothetical protein
MKRLDWRYTLYVVHYTIRTSLDFECVTSSSRVDPANKLETGLKMINFPIIPLCFLVLVQCTSLTAGLFLEEKILRLEKNYVSPI